VLSAQEMISGDQFKCVLCRRLQSNELIFTIEPCGHAACKQCASNYYQIHNPPVKCWIGGCNTVIANSPLVEIPLSVLNDAAVVSGVKEQPGESPIPDESEVPVPAVDLFKCEKCEKDARQDTDLFINSNCLHVCCVSCAGNHILNRIERKVYPIDCWVSECKVGLELSDCQRVVPEETLQKYQEASLKKWTAVDQSVGGVSVVRCCQIFCDWFFTVDKKDVLPKWVTCQKCSVMFCPKCRMEIHDSLSCESNLKLFNKQAIAYSELSESVYKEEIKVDEVVSGYKCVVFSHQSADAEANPLVHNPQYAIFENSEIKEIVVAFRGTQTIFDALVDFSFVQSVDKAGAIHFGIDSHLKLVREKVLNLLKERAGAENLTLVGHSLGGGYSLALMVHVLQNAEVLSEIQRVKVVTFGSPLVFAKDSLDELMNKKPVVKVEVWNYIHNDDIVPRFLGENLYGGTVLSLLKTIKIIGKDQVDALVKLEQTFSLFKPIGNFIFLRRQGYFQISYAVEVETGGPDLNSRRPDLWKIYWPPTCLEDHKLKNYTNALTMVSKESIASDPPLRRSLIIP
jgi:hypothetical protein